MTKILYFGWLSDVTGKTDENLTIPDNIESAGQLRAWLDERLQTDGALLDPTVRIAIDREIILDTASLNGAGEIALMPPVGGG